MGWKELDIPNAQEAAGFRQEFQKRARFLLDESLGVAVANLLRRSGWNAKFVADVGLAGRDDQDVLAFAQRDDRILLTHDQGFLDDRKYPEHRNPGIVILPGAGGDIVALIQALQWSLSIVGQFREVWRKSKIVMGNDGTFRVTSRNADTGAMDTRRYWLTKGTVFIWEDENK